MNKWWVKQISNEMKVCKNHGDLYLQNWNSWMKLWNNEWMNEWLNEWMNEWINEWMNGWINEWMNKWMSE